MKITFLGTGTSQGVPMIGCVCDVCRSLDFRDKRLRTALLVETEETSLVIDELIKDVTEEYEKKNAAADKL